MIGAGDGLKEHENGLLLSVRVSPGARQTKAPGWEPGAGGQMQLRLRVSAPPEKGKANEAVLKLLAGLFGVPRGRLRLVSGESGRTKTVLIEGEAAALRAALDKALCAEGRQKKK
ncbi:DUF167 domain-containing protein [Tepidicaulis sp. LMO-SS28]|uniref:DUF167 domain-containing protein n=1 Tax=Tepidicaulis sp. LMO-SS28 TaxID=3447455 RepID=UPI003EDF171F